MRRGLLVLLGACVLAVLAGQIVGPFMARTTKQNAPVRDSGWQPFPMLLVGLEPGKPVLDSRVRDVVWREGESITVILDDVHLELRSLDDASPPPLARSEKLAISFVSRPDSGTPEKAELLARELAVFLRRAEVSREVPPLSPLR